MVSTRRPGFWRFTHLRGLQKGLEQRVGVGAPPCRETEDEQPLGRQCPCAPCGTWRNATCALTAGHHDTAGAILGNQLWHFKLGHSASVTKLVWGFAGVGVGGALEPHLAVLRETPDDSVLSGDSFRCLVTVHDCGDLTWAVGPVP